MADGGDEYCRRLERKSLNARTIGILGDVPGLIKKGPGGVNLFRESKIWESTFPIFAEELGAMMPVAKEMVSEGIDDVRKLTERYREETAKFRSEIKNDIAALKASTDQLEKSVNRMQAAYNATAATLTSPQFQQGIENAERMAKALTAISELQSHSVTFAILDRKISSP
jgi:uncharacterized protein YukE